MDNLITYEVTPAVHEALKEFFDRIDGDTIRHILSVPNAGVTFSEPEIEIRTQLVFQFYFNRILPIDKALGGPERGSEIPTDLSAPF